MARQLIQLDKKKQLYVSGMTLTPTGIQENKTLTEEQWQAAGEVLGEISKRCMWYIGDWYRIGADRKWGEMYDDCEERFGVPYKTAANAQSVCNAIEFSRRRVNLPFSFHQEVQGLDEDAQDELLANAEKKEWTRQKLREQVRARKRDQEAAEEDHAELPDLGTTIFDEWGVRLDHDDCRQFLKTLSDDSVNCCVTSPPYFNLRDYDADDQIGQEEAAEEYVADIVKVFREVRRALKPNGTCWLNLGDTYHKGSDQNGLKPKDLIGIPWAVAFALRDDGWYLRQDIIWHKPNPMPEPSEDRCTAGHEYIFLLTKEPSYYFAHELIQEPAIYAGDNRADRTDNRRGTECKSINTNTGETRRKRSVWTVATQPYKEAHFAVFPPTLIEPCILAGCPPNGLVLDPFAGSGTTAQVAFDKQCRFIGCEINAEYCQLFKKRFSEVQPHLFKARA